MKYGKVLDFRTKDKAVVGKKYVYNNIFYKIANSPETCFIGVLERVRENEGLPFVFQDDYNHQFIREIIEEQPKYRPYKDTDEMVEDFKKRTRLVTYDFCYPSIWIKSCDGFVSLITEFGFGCVWSSVHQVGISMKELFDSYTYLDGSPCGIKEE